ncbi:polysaccharide transporter protein [Clostridium putrefaciens]|uniref:Polysaccharide transporter protein n=1 Tax=Clostridium putrefaciens TaxID=99675 RepID=A0A381J523_9CLOT|nr:oligosaccharide flippase family protein [Clostridium putrefaciens]SUY45668.1 polysaccharide transporter protein [Clostridium putrefaciens]
MSKSIAKNALYKVLLNIFNIIMPIIIATYTYRVMTKELIGRYTAAYTIFNYFFIFAGFGIYNYAIRELSKVRDNKKKMSQLFTSFFVIGLISNIVTIIAYVAFNYTLFKGTPVFAVHLILALNMISNIFYIEWANEALENYGFITLKTIIVRLVYAALLFLTVKSSKDFLIYVFLTTFSTFLNNIISYIYIKKGIGFDFSNIKIKRHIKFLLLVIVMSNGNVLYTQLDKVMLAHYVGEISVAYYGVANNVMNIINALVLSVVFVTIPRLSNIIASKDHERYINLLNKITQTLFAFLFPVAIGMFVLAEEIFVLFGGGEYAGGGPVLKVFCLYMISLGMEAILTNQVMYVNRREKQLVPMIFMAGFINIILNYLLLKFNVFNEVTAIATTTVSSYMLIFIEYIYTRKVLNIKFNMFNFKNFRYLLYALTFLPISFIFKSLISNMYIYIVAIVLTSGIVYTLFLFITKDEIWNTAVNRFMPKIKTKLRR